MNIKTKLLENMSTLLITQRNKTNTLEYFFLMVLIMFLFLCYVLFIQLCEYK